MMVYVLNLASFEKTGFVLHNLNTFPYKYENQTGYNFSITHTLAVLNAYTSEAKNTKKFWEKN